MRENAKLKSWLCAPIGATFHYPSPYIIETTHIVLPTLCNIIQFLSSDLLVVVILSSFPAPETPITPRDLPSPSPKSFHMDHKAIFGIVFVLGLFLLIEVGYACVGWRVRFTWFIEVSKLICDTSNTVMKRLSSFRVFKSVEKAADAHVDAHDVGAASSTLPTHGGSSGTGNFSTIFHSAQVARVDAVMARESLRDGV
ncbi:hypothetical protein H4582DRAFT_1145526 [Lactarius indigo]|nr:hypothetical protein H4582DRAFT_1145526 [Lactarius indigo]